MDGRILGARGDRGPIVAQQPRGEGLLVLIRLGCKLGEALDGSANHISLAVRKAFHLLVGDLDADRDLRGAPVVERREPPAEDEIVQQARDNHRLFVVSHLEPVGELQLRDSHLREREFAVANGSRLRSLPPLARVRISRTLRSFVG